MSEPDWKVSCTVFVGGHPAYDIRMVKRTDSLALALGVARWAPTMLKHDSIRVTRVSPVSDGKTYAPITSYEFDGRTAVDQWHFEECDDRGLDPYPLELVTELASGLPSPALADLALTTAESDRLLAGEGEINAVAVECWEEDGDDIAEAPFDGITLFPRGNTYVAAAIEGWLLEHPQALADLMGHRGAISVQDVNVDFCQGDWTIEPTSEREWSTLTQKEEINR